MNEKATAWWIGEIAKLVPKIAKGLKLRRDREWNWKKGQKGKPVKPKEWVQKESADGWMQETHDTWIYKKSGSPFPQVCHWYANELPRPNGEGPELVEEGYYASKQGIPFWIGPFATLETAKLVSLYLQPQE